MVLSKETDSASDASTVVAEAVTPIDHEFEHASGVPNAYHPPDLKDQTRTSPALCVDHSIPIPAAEEQASTKEDFGGEGIWKHGLCHCFSVFCEPLFWMACFCTPLVFGQLMTRMELNWCGHPDREYGGSKTFATVAILFIVTFFIQWVGLEIIGLVFFVYCLIVFTRTRSAIRRQFRIPPRTCKCCNGRLEDFCCGLWCSCCSSIQMARHTALRLASPRMLLHWLQGTRRKKPLQ